MPAAGLPQALIAQEVSQERWIEIPDEVHDVLKMWRPSPLYRACRWEKALDTPAKIYYKWEGVSPAGSHKPNTAMAQAYYGKKEGLEGFATETGAGQWGSALCLAGRLFGMKSRSSWSPSATSRSPTGASRWRPGEATVVPSPSSETHAGQAVLAEDPDTPAAWAWPSARPWSTL